MPALIGVVLSYAALVSGVPGTGASAQLDMCAPGAGVCQVQGATVVSSTAAAEAYATPIEVDCSALPGAPVDAGVSAGELLSIGCAAPAFDFRYRVSRFADSERPNGALGPQRGRRAARSGATCQGLPPDHGGLVTTSGPPLAIYAMNRLTPPGACRVQYQPARGAATRIVEPLDRPPRV